jgi:hypothetical protein
MFSHPTQNISPYIIIQSRLDNDQSSSLNDHELANYNEFIPNMSEAFLSFAKGEI